MKKESNEKIRLVVEGTPQDEESITSQYGNLYVIEYAPQNRMQIKRKSNWKMQELKLIANVYSVWMKEKLHRDVVETEKSG